MIFTLQANIRTRYAIAHLYLCLFAGHQEDGLVVQARGAQGSFHGDLFAHVHVFGTGLHAELRVPPHPELDARAQPRATEPVTLLINGQHVGHQKFHLQKLVDFPISQGGKAVVPVLCLFHEHHIHVLLGGNSHHNVVPLSGAPGVDDLVTALKFGNLVEIIPATVLVPLATKSTGITWKEFSDVSMASTVPTPS